MKTIILSLCTLTLLGSASSYGQGGGNPPPLTPGAFVTVWRTSTASETITIPTEGSGYNYTVKWGDSKPDDTGRTGSVTHTYDAAGDYTVTITGDFPRIYFNNAGDKGKILEVKQWGSQVWASMYGAFWGCSQLQITATDVPNLSSVPSTTSMFRSCTQLTGHASMSRWDVSHVTFMTGMFNGAAAFNQPLNDWDVSSVTDMSWMFQAAAVFNQNLNDWNVSKVKNMSGVFFKAAAFNQNLNEWNVSSVTNMNSMFSDAVAFDGDISDWNVSKVTDMSYMFKKTGKFNQDISNWNVSSVSNMSYMFKEATSFNLDIGSWNVSAVTNMTYMFKEATSFNLDIGSWNVSAVTNMSYMFWHAAAFNQPLNDWDVSNVTNMNSLFSDAVAFNQDISRWNVSSVTNMGFIFMNASNFSSAHYTQLLIKWAQLSVTPNLSFNGPPSGYCSIAQDAYNALTTQKNWKIRTGNSVVADCSVPAQSRPGTPTQYPTPATPTTLTLSISSYDWGAGADGTPRTPGTLALHYQVVPGGTFSPVAVAGSSGVRIASALKPAGGKVVVSGVAPSTAYQFKLVATPSGGGATTESDASAVIKAFIPVTSVTLAPNPLNLKTGKKGTLVATIAPSDATNPAVKWESSDPSIATVSASGEVTALKAGTATMTATSQADGTKTGRATVKVTDIAVTSVTLAPDPLNLKTGKKGTLVATIAPSDATNQAVNWTSSDRSVADISDAGEVTALKAGTATMTATSRADGTKTASATVKVTDIAVASVMLNKASITLSVGEEWTPRVTIAPSDATNQAATYESSEPSVATVSTVGLVKALKMGNATITVKSAADRTKTASVAVTVNPADPKDLLAIDANFFRLLKANHGSVFKFSSSGGKHYISKAQANAYTGELNLSNPHDAADALKISSLAGIEEFVQLTSLRLSYHLLPTLDVSRNTQLTHLDVNHNRLNTLQVSANTALENLNVSYNALPTIDVSANTRLSTLMVGGATTFASLDVSANTALSELTVYESSLNALDVSNQAQLQKLTLRSTPLRALDVSSNLLLASLYFEDNDVITELDISKNTALTHLSVKNTTLSALDVSKHTRLAVLDATSNTALTCIQVADPRSIPTGWSKDVRARYALHCGPPRSFITVWRTTTANEEITIPTTGTGYSYNVDWGDGSTDNNTYDGNAPHTYATANDYTVTITGDFPRIYFNGDNDKNPGGDDDARRTNAAKILEVKQWGTQAWISMYSAFYGCSNLQITATDVPELTLVLSTTSMFRGCTQLTGHASMSRWNVSSVTFMTGMFNGAAAFNQPLNEWNVSKVTDMSWMFQDAAAFDQPLNDWNVSNVKNMEGMFIRTAAFNQDISSWDISKVTTMKLMFSNASAYSSENYTKFLIAWAKLDVKSDVEFNVPSVQYCNTAQEAREKLENDNLWTLYDDQGAADCSNGIPPPPKRNLHAPVLSDIVDQEVEVGSELKVKLVATDADNPEQLYYSVDLASESKGIVIEEVEGEVFLKWTPSTNDEGDNPVIVTVKDGIQVPQPWMVQKNIKQDAKEFNIKIVPATALSLQAAENTLLVSPIPTTRHLTVRMKNTTIGKLTLRLSTLLGNQVWQRTAQKASEVWEQSMDLSTLPDGVYMLEVIAEGQRWTRKVVKE